MYACLCENYTEQNPFLAAYRRLLTSYYKECCGFITCNDAAVLLRLCEYIYSIVVLVGQTTVSQYYHDIKLLMIYWETYLVKPFATLNTLISAVFFANCAMTLST
ncbi:conserved hypothetical protein [Trichinella spiralis]|uniref:hypothetical protein n=1 Tax=Trichinella spiralis TaxID=6334 RepID=UPI0001EFC4C7|nr:conserved hypothetical protein [Trichinella spiralis]